MSSILNSIKAGEDSYNEFKNASFHNESLDKEALAFSNMKSSSIWIGVQDKGTISGNEDKKIK